MCCFDDGFDLIPRDESSELYGIIGFRPGRKGFPLTISLVRAIDLSPQDHCVTEACQHNDR